MTSIFFAQLFGMYLMVKGVAIFMHADSMQDLMKQFRKNKALEVLAAALATFLGVALILLHNEWDSPWQSLISLIAWGMFIKGTLMLWAPELMYKWAEKMNHPDYYRVGATVAYLVGVYLIFFGF